MNADLEIVWCRIFNLDSVADALVLLGLIVRTGDVVIEIFDRFKMMRLVERNCQGGSRRKLNPSQINVVVPIRVCQVRLFTDNAD